MFFRMSAVRKCTYFNFYIDMKQLATKNVIKGNGIVGTHSSYRVSASIMRRLNVM